jgi:O-succinylbenzoate synthase
VERFGKEDKTAVKRIPALKKSIEKLNRIIKRAEKQNLQLVINSEISIALINNK